MLSGERQWNGLSDWAVPADGKQRVEKCHSTHVQCRTAGRSRNPREQRVVARVAQLVLAQHQPASVEPGGQRQIRRGLRAWLIMVGLWDASVHVEDCQAVVGIVSI